MRGVRENFARAAMGGGAKQLSARLYSDCFALVGTGLDFQNALSQMMVRHLDLPGASWLPGWSHSRNRTIWGHLGAPPLALLEAPNVNVQPTSER